MAKKEWKDLTRKEKRTAIIALAVIVLAVFTVIGVATSGGDKQEQDKQQQASQQNQPEDKQIEQIVRDTVKAENLREVRATEQVDGGYGVFVKFYDKYGIKGVIGEQMADIYKALYTSGKDVRTVSIVANTTLTDQYGNESEEAVLKTTLDKAVADKVNFNASEADLQYSILPGLWTVNSTHPALRD
jgi:hypothetical protein